MEQFEAYIEKTLQTHQETTPHKPIEETVSPFVYYVFLLFLGSFEVYSGSPDPRQSFHEKATHQSGRTCVSTVYSDVQWTPQRLCVDLAMRL